MFWRNGKQDNWKYDELHRVFFGIDPETHLAVQLPIFSYQEDPIQFMPPTLPLALYKD